MGGEVLGAFIPNMIPARAEVLQQEGELEHKVPKFLFFLPRSPSRQCKQKGNSIKCYANPQLMVGIGKFRPLLLIS